MANPKSETVFDPAEIEATRAQVRAIMAAENLSQADIARDAGIKYGTFTGWMAGNENLDNSKHTATVQIWMTARADNQVRRAKVPQVPGYQPTPSSEAFLDTLQFAQIAPEISVIAGGAGIGKTTAIRQYQATHPNVWVATMSPASASVNAMMKEVCDVIGITEKSATELVRAIGRRVEGKGGLLIIDEAQHLSTAALEQLRSFYDIYDVGIALVGNETVYSRLDGAGAKGGFAQLFSRVGMRITQIRPKPQDMCALIAAWEVTDRDEIKTLKAIASKPGALRAMTKCLQLASMLAAGSDEPRAIKHIKAAYSRLSTNDTSS